MRLPIFFETATITDTATTIVPNINTGSVVTGILYFLIFLFVASVGGFLGYYFIQKKKYKHKITIFEKVSGRFEPTKKDVAMEVSVGKGGDKAFHLRKGKKWIPRPSIQTGRNTYWFMLREDGELVNVGVEDIDETLKKAKVHYIDVEMRYARAGLQKNLKDRYDRPSFLQQYGTLISGMIIVLITGILMFLLFDKFLDLTAQLSSLMSTAQKVAEENQRLLAGIDTIRSGGTGFITG